MVKKEIQNQKVITHIFLPFRRTSDEKILKNEDYWEGEIAGNKPIKGSIHLLKYVKDIIKQTEKSDGKENNVVQTGGMRFYHFKNDKRSKINLPARQKEYIQIKNKKSNVEEKIIVNSICVYDFDTGIGFLEIEINYSPELTIDTIIDIAYRLKKIGFTYSMYQYEKKIGKDKINIIEPKTQLMDSIMSELVGVEYFFHSASEKKFQAFMYHTYGKMRNDAVQVTEGQDQNSETMFQLMRSYKGSYKGNFNADTIGEGYYKPYPYIHWAYSQEGIVCHYTYDFDGKISESFECNTLEDNLNTDYKIVIILLLHQKFLLLDFMERMMNNYNNRKELERLQRDFVDFQMRYAFNIVSDERAYHHLYKKMSDVLSLKELYLDIEDVTNKIIELKEKSKNHKQTLAVSLITALTILSVYNDGLPFLKALLNIGAEARPDGWWIMITIMVVIFASAGIVYFDVLGKIKEFGKSRR